MKPLAFLDSNAFSVLEALLNHRLHLREIAEKTGLAPSTVFKILSNFRKNGMVGIEPVKNRKIVELNYGSPLTSKAVSLLFVEKILRAKGFEKLLQLKPKSVFLFGTAHSGKIMANSDIDLAVFFGKKPNSFLLSQIKSVLGNELSREIDLIVLTKEKIKSLRQQEAELLNQIANKSTLLWGEALDLA